MREIERKFLILSLPDGLESHPASEIRQIRYELDQVDVTIELDVFRGTLCGLCLAEVEFPSNEAAGAFCPPNWFGEEVTDDERFKNKSLALHGRPEDCP
jgi:CYTH domain-containing protein